MLPVARGRRSIRRVVLPHPALLLLLPGLAGCGGADGAAPSLPPAPEPPTPEPAVTRTFDFDSGPLGFVADFADYPPADEAIYRLRSGHRVLPSPLEAGSGLYIAGVNRSDDLFGFFKGSVDGLTPGARYAATVEVQIATSVPAGCVGVGGAPGESVWIKAGATAAEPLPVMEGDYLRMNVDVGRQANGGGEAAVLGNVANSRNCEEPPAWELKSFPSASVPAVVSVPGDGRIWLLLGFDSGFEAETEVYFTRASLTLTPAS